MKKKVILVLSALLQLGYLEAQVEKHVLVDVPCYRRNDKGECMEWGALVRGCKGTNVPCTAVTYNIFTKQGGTCVANPGATCSSITQWWPGLQVGTTTVNIPCIANDGTGKCILWSSLNKGCRGPEGGTCKIDFALGDRHAICNAESKAVCNSNIVVR